MKRRVVILISLMGTVALAWLLLSPPAVKEPVYQGKPLSYWFTDAGFDEANSKLGASPSVPHLMAVRDLGTNAIPTLLRLLRSRDSTVKLKLIGLAQKQHFIKINFTPAYNLNQRAADACGALGPAASNAVPELIALCGQTNFETTVATALTALCKVGPAASNAVPAIAKMLNSPGTAAAEWRLPALWALGEIHSHLETALPVLTNELQSTNWRTRNATIRALRTLGPDAKAAVPALIQMLNNPTLIDRDYAAIALGDIHSDPDLSVPALAQAAESQVNAVALRATEALAQFGADAKPAVPTLLKLARSTAPFVSRVVVRKTLAAIDPEAAGKTEEK